MRSRFDPAWLDAQYNNRALVPDHAAYFERWGRASALAREGSAGAQLDLAYGSADGETLDLFPPSASAGGPAPVLVFIHGGYWRALDKSDFSFVAPALNAAGALVVVPNYALCPAVTVEHITLQMVAALAWTWRNAARFGGDASRIVVAGHSAGGHAAAMMVSCRWKQVAADLPAQLVRAGLAISGLYDLEPLRHTPFLQPDLRLTAASVARLSPAFFPRPRAAPLVAVAGADESEEFQRQNRLIRDVWGPTAVPVCETLPEANHLSILTSLADPAGRLHDFALRLLGLR
ncbi:MAG: alpha/beta hydrolase [Burkholderiales bacterium]|nr:alpha/beta hydrolase [Burkholderiales bacterium]